MGHVDQDQEEGRSQAVVETAVDVERLPDSSRYRIVGHERLAQRGVGRCQCHGQERDRLQREVRGQQDADEPACDHRQRQAHDQQPDRDGVLVQDRARVHPARVGEEDDNQGDLGRNAHGLAVQSDVQGSEDMLAEQQARTCEEHRHRHDVPSRRPANKAKSRTVRATSRMSTSTPAEDILGDVHASPGTSARHARSRGRRWSTGTARRGTAEARVDRSVNADAVGERAPLRLRSTTGFAALQQGPSSGHHFWKVRANASIRATSSLLSMSWRVGSGWLVSYRILEGARP